MTAYVNNTTAPVFGAGVESPPLRRCRHCGIPLEYDGERWSPGIISYGRHSINQENSYDYTLCNGCCATRLEWDKP